MPQIWMTYIELGSLLACAPHEARDRAISIGADRKRSRDGLSRVKLPPSWAELFIERIRSNDRSERVARELSELQHLHQRSQQTAQPEPQMQPQPFMPKLELGAPATDDQPDLFRPIADSKAA